MSIKHELQQADENNKLSLPAKRLMEKLAPIPSKPDEMSRRWFWELLQNASDYNEVVDVRVEITDTHITFSHNGESFSPNDAINLISPDSGKDTPTKEETIGKFGSGLISTHFLSSYLEVKGLIKAESGKLHAFTLPLDRHGYDNKEALIESQKASRLMLDKQLDVSGNQPVAQEGFNTSFSYDLTKPLAGTYATNYLGLSFDYICNLLPYTLSFMPKVKSVEFVNKSTFIRKFQAYKIDREEVTNEKVTFRLEQDQSKPALIEMLYFDYGQASTTIRIQEKTLQPFPSNSSKLFCGLPLIGSEQIGLPIIVNSTKFMPTSEREGIELSPMDKQNRSVFSDVLKLYQQVIQHLVKEQYSNLFEIASIGSIYRGSEASSIFFKRDFTPKLASILKEQKIIQNTQGEYLSLAEVKIPYSDSKTSLNTELLSAFEELAVAFKPRSIPSLSSIRQWRQAIDFSYFREASYSFTEFLKEVSQVKQLEGFILYNREDTMKWLIKVIEVTAQADSNLFNKYSLFPNRIGGLKSKEEKIYWGDNIPSSILEIHDSLAPNRYGDLLLHEKADICKEYLGAGRIKTVKDVCNLVDELVKEEYSKHNGSTASFIVPLKDLMSWYQGYSQEKPTLKELFPWFSQKRPVLFLDTFNERERNAALNIAQSGKMEALSRLASTGISEAEIDALCKKSHLLLKVLEQLQDEVDDETFADKQTGLKGEQIVYEDLQKKYPSYQGYEVIWASQETKETRYDFEVKQKGEVILYIDAKSTIRGLYNSNSIPFFMRLSQWNFLDEQEAQEKYQLARVFLGSNPSKVIYLDIKKGK